MDMKEGVTSLDLMFLVRELKEKLINGNIQGIKQIDKTFLFEIYNQGKRFFLKLILPTAIYTTTVTQQAHETPPNFCMLLRKYLINKTVSDIRQHEFDRIIEIETNENKLVIELFSTGNIILTDSHNMIIGVFEQQIWKDRIIKPKTIYKYPPTNLNPFKHEFFEFQKILKQINKEIVKALAVDFGFGGIYTEEFCKKLEIDKNKFVNQLSQQEVDKLFRFFEQLKTSQVRPSVVVEDKKSVDVIPFETFTYQDYKKISFDNLNDTLEAYFEGLEKMKEVKRKEKTIDTERKKMERIRKQQEKQLKEMQEDEQRYRTVAKLLYEKYDVFNDVLSRLNELKRQGKSWKEIKKEIKVKELRQDEAKIIISVDSFDVEVDFRKSVEENANYYFERAKKLKEKIENIQIAMKKFEEMKPLEKIERPKIKKPSKKWYERYRWFISSNGILVIAGKNARNNETIIKRYTRPQDLVLHVDIRGSPFTVIRNDQKLERLPPETIYEAAEFAATYSRAWDQKLASVSVYYIRPEQVVKEGGLPLGSFMIHGERKWLEKIKPRLSIGVKEEKTFKAKLIFGPPTAVKKQTPYMVTIVLGDRDAGELTQEIKKQLLLKVPYEIKKAIEEIDLEEIKKVIPYGRGELVR